MSIAARGKEEQKKEKEKYNKEQQNDQNVLEPFKVFRSMNIYQKTKIKIYTKVIRPTGSKLWT